MNFELFQYFRNCVLSVTAFCACSSPIIAQNATWISSASGLWSQSSSWKDGLVANGNNSLADFSTINYPSATSVTLDSSRVVSGLITGDIVPSHPWTLSTSNSSTLTLSGSTGSNWTVTNQVTNANVKVIALYGFRKKGPGHLALRNLCEVSNTTTVEDGTLELAFNSQGNGTIGGSLTINRGAKLICSVTNALGTSGNNWVRSINIDGGTLESTAANSDCGWGVSYQLKDATLRASGTGSRFSAGGNTNFTINSGNTGTVLNGELRLREGNSGNLLNINVYDGAALSDLTINGPISASASGFGINFYGGGLTRIAGTGTYTGATTVTEGTLQLDGALNSSSVRIRNAAKLTGSGTLGVGGTIEGILAPGDSSISSIRTNGALSVATSGKISVQIKKTNGTITNDTITGTGVITLSSATFEAQLAPGSQQLAVNDTFTIFSNTSRSGTFARFNLPALPPHLRWNTSNLISNGLISVAANGAIPVVTTLGFQAQDHGSFRLNGRATSAAPIDCFFEIGQSTSSVTRVFGPNNVTNSTSAFDFAATVYALEANKTYYYRAVAVDTLSGFRYEGQFLQIATNNLMIPPTLRIGIDATNVTGNSVVLHGLEINAGSANTTARFEWGVDGQIVNSLEYSSTLAASTTTNISLPLSIISYERNYFYRIRLTSAHGEYVSPLKNFTLSEYASFSELQATGGPSSFSISGTLKVAAKDPIRLFVDYGPNLQNFVELTNYTNLANNTTQVSSVITGLLPNTEYPVRLRCYAAVNNSFQQVYSETIKVLTNADNGSPAFITQPSVKVMSNNGITLSSGTMWSGSANANYSFEYGLTTSFGKSIAGGTLLAGSSINWETTIPNYIIGATYYVRMILNQNGNIVQSNTLTIPIRKDIVSTNDAINVGDYHATIGGDLYTLGTSTQTYTTYVQYGLTPELGKTIQVATEVKATAEPITFTKHISGLIPGQKYYFRFAGFLGGSNAPSIFGEIKTFTTQQPSSPPYVSVPNQKVTVTHNSATITESDIFSGAGDAMVSIEYGKGVNLTDTLVYPVPIFSGSFGNATFYLPSLLPQTTYSYRIIARSNFGNYTSAVRTFTTIDIPTLVLAPPIFQTQGVTFAADMNPKGGSYNYVLQLTKDGTFYSDYQISSGIVTAADGKQTWSQLFGESYLTAGTYKAVIKATLKQTNISYYSDSITFNTGSSSSQSITSLEIRSVNIEQVAVYINGVNAGPTGGMLELLLQSASGSHSRIINVTQLSSNQQASRILHTVDDLLQGRTYTMSARIVSGNSIYTSNPITFSTPENPYLVTVGAQGINTSKTITGLNYGLPSQLVVCEYGTSPAFGQYVNVYANDGDDVIQEISASLSNLKPSTAYYYRIATLDGKYKGETLTFVTGYWDPFDSHNASSAAPDTINFTATYDGSEKIEVEYGLTKNYGSRVMLTYETSSNKFLGSVNGLLPATQYYYRFILTRNGKEILSTNSSIYTSQSYASAITGPATRVADHFASVNAACNTTGASVSFSIEYSSSQSSLMSAWLGSARHSYLQTYSTTLTNLTPNTTYYYRAVLDANPRIYGETKSFTTTLPSALPKFETVSHQNVSSNGATLSANTITAGGTNTTLRFEYGKTQNLGTISAISQGLTAYSTRSNSSVSLQNLEPSTRYYYRFIASCSLGDTTSDLFWFDTSGSPSSPSLDSIVTMPAIRINPFDAMLVANVSLGNSSAAVGFRLGTSPTNLNIGINPDPYIVNANSTSPVAGIASQLLPNTLYYYKAEMRINNIYYYGELRSFQTPVFERAPSFYLPLDISSISQSACVVNTSGLWTGGSATTLIYEYGTADPLDKVFRVSGSFPANTSLYNQAQAPIIGLLPNRVYRIRAKATNSFGFTYSSETEFRTLEDVIVNPPVSVFSTLPATQVGATSATLNGQIPNDIPAGLHAFQYGKNRVDEFTVSFFDVQFLQGSTTTNFYAVLSNLTPGTKYNFRALYEDADTLEKVYGNTISFTTTGSSNSSPIMSSFSSSNSVTSLIANMGSYYSGNTASELFLEWGNDPSLGFSQLIGNYPANSTTADISNTIKNLSPDKDYYYRWRARAGAVTILSDVFSLRTNTAPPLPTMNLTDVTDVSASGTVTYHPNLSALGYKVLIQYSAITPDFEEFGPNNFGIIEPSNIGPYTAAFNLSTLQPNTRYYVRATLVRNYSYSDQEIIARNADSFVTKSAISPPALQGTWGGSISSSGIYVSISNVFAGGADTSIYFDYGLTNNFTHTAVFGNIVPIGTVSSFIYYTSIPILQNGSLHYGRIRLVNAYGTWTSETKVFKSDNRPEFTISPASSITDTSASLSGSIDPKGSYGSASLIYTKTSESFVIPANFTLAFPFSTPSTINQSLIGLEPNTEYQYKIVGKTNTDAQLIESPVGTFRTAPASSAPSISRNLSHRSVSTTSIWLAGLQLYSGGANSTVKMELSSGGSLIRSEVMEPLPRGSLRELQNVISALLPNTTYSVQFIAENQFGVARSIPYMIQASPSPQVVTGKVIQVYPESATVEAMFVTSTGEGKKYSIEYGTTAQLGQQYIINSLYNNTGSAYLYRLFTNTTYYYRAKMEDLISGEIFVGETRTVHLGTPQIEVTDVSSAKIIRSNDFLQFGTGEESYTSTKVISIKNKGFGTLEIEDLLIGGVDHLRFSYNVDKTALGPQESALLTIVHSSTTIDNRSAIFYVITNDNLLPQFNLQLAGNRPTLDLTTLLRTGPRSVNVSGAIDALGNQLSLVFEYGIDGVFDHQISSNPPSVTADQSSVMQSSVDNLRPGTTFQFRARAFNRYGTYVSNVQSVYIPSNIALLSDLNLGGISYSPQFSEAELFYIGSVPFATSSMKVIAMPKHPNAIYTVNGSNADIPLSLGDNLIRVKVTAEDEVTMRYYEARITRLPEYFEFNSNASAPVTVDGFHVNGISANVVLSYAPQPGSILTLINNTSSDFIQGHFSNLAHGQRITLVYDGKVYDFVANYYGGTGNDLVLHWANTKLFTWGQNNFGQLGDGGTARSLTPKEIPAHVLLDGKTIIAAGAGYLHSMVLCSDGSLVSWGYNIYGQLGDGTKTHRSTPVAVNQIGSLAGRRVVSISVGPYHQLVLCADGTLHAWGHNSHGQLGIGSKIDASTPVQVIQVGALSNKSVVAVAAGSYHSLALCSDGTVVSWGFNEEGELGNGSFVSSVPPVSVNTTGALAGKRVIQIAAGQYHSMALCSDNTLVAWGYNLRGQLGNGTTSHINSPTSVNQAGALSGKMIRSLRAGLFHSAVLCSDGAVALWGGNNRQQLGITSSSQSTVPILLSQSAEDISSGGFFLTIRRLDGSLASWGENNNGQLGNGSTLQSASPVSVLATAFPVDSRPMFHASGSAALHNLSIIALPAADAPLNGIEAWRLTTFGIAATSPDAADHADCDADGTCNLLEYAMGTNPHLFDTAKAPTWQKVGDFMELKLSDAAIKSDIIYGAECSSTLRDNDWQNVPAVRANGERIFRIPVDSSTRMFMRLKVTRP